MSNKNTSEENPAAAIDRLEREINNPQAIAGTGRQSDSGAFLAYIMS